MQLAWGHAALFVLLPMSPRVSWAEFQALKRKAAERKTKRIAKAKMIGTWSPPRKDVKDAIVTELGRRDMLINGTTCRIHGHHRGELAYHLTPQSRGDAARFIPENVVWACAAANDGERWHRTLYREKHIAIFGIERVERIEAISRTHVHFSDADLMEKLRFHRRENEELSRLKNNP